LILHLPVIFTLNHIYIKPVMAHSYTSMALLSYCLEHFAIDPACIDHYAQDSFRVD